MSLGNLAAERDFTYVDDTAAALDALLWVPVQKGEVFNIGSGKVISIGALARLLGALMGHASITISVEDRRLRRRDLERLCCDPEKLRTRTGWTPSVGLEHGLEMTLTWFKENGSRWLWQERLQDSLGQDRPQLSTP